MSIYISTIVLLLVLSLLELNVTMSLYTKRALSLIVYTLLVLQVGLRWETGTDWSHYYEHFESIGSLSSASPSPVSPEYGYNLALWLVKLASPNYSVFLLAHAATYYFLIFNSIRRYTGLLYLPLMIFYCGTMGYTGSNRELIALAIGLYALRYIHGKLLYFFLLTAIACSFHYSAVILLPLPLIKLKIRPALLFCLFTLAVAVGLSPLPQLTFSAVGNFIGGAEVYKAAFYLANSPNSLQESGLSPLGLVKRLVLLGIFFYNRRSLSEKLPYYAIMLNVYVAGVVLYFLFASSLPIVVSRGSLYFDVFEPLLLASQIYLFKRKSNRLVMASGLCALSFVFFIQSISSYPDLFVPYQGLFINTGYSRITY